MTMFLKKKRLKMRRGTVVQRCLAQMEVADTSQTESSEEQVYGGKTAFGSMME